MIARWIIGVVALNEISSLFAENSRIGEISFEPATTSWLVHHATSRYFNESNQPFSPDETPRSVQPGPRDRHLTQTKYA
jgi:hypothetical protein